MAEDRGRTSESRSGSSLEPVSREAGSPIRVIVADDHSLFRESLARVLGQREEFEVCGVAATAEEAVTVVAEKLPDIALIDVAMPGGGIEATKAIRSQYPRTLVVMLSAYGYEHYVVSALRAGAVGYITKTATVDYLCAALKMVSRGEIVCDYDARTVSTGSVFGDGPGGASGTSPQASRVNRRELEILRHVAKGLSNRAIAQTLGISERTVQAHMVNAFGKLGVRTRTAAVMKCVSGGLIEADKAT